MVNSWFSFAKTTKTKKKKCPRGNNGFIFVFFLYSQILFSATQDSDSFLSSFFFFCCFVFHTIFFHDFHSNWICRKGLALCEIKRKKNHTRKRNRHRFSFDFSLLKSIILIHWIMISLQDLNFQIIFKLFFHSLILKLPR